MEWISVNDKLPKCGETVIVYYPKMRCEYWPFVFSATYKEFKNGACTKTFSAYDFYYNIGGPDGITYWMPLPNPPEE